MLVAPITTDTIASLASASEAARQRGDYGLGAQLARQAADQAAMLGDHRQQSGILVLQANQLLRLGQSENAVTAAGDAARLYAVLGDEPGQSRALTVAAMGYLALGLPEEALEALSTSLEIAQRRRDPELLFWTYNRIGNAYSGLDQHTEARAFLLRALPFAVGLGAEAKFCILNNLADNAATLATHCAAADQAGIIAAGLGHARDALELARAAGHPYREAICLGNQAKLLLASGDTAGAYGAVTRSHALAAEKGYTPVELEARTILAQLALADGETALAIARLEDVRPALEATGDLPTLVGVHKTLSELYQALGDAEAALEQFKIFHRLEGQQRTAVAETRVRLMTSMTELSAVRLEAERARLEIQLHQMQLAELDAERRELLQRATELDRVAHEDDLTGLKNRRFARGALAERIAQCPAGQEVFVAIVDADHFKAINDRFGHGVGDMVLAGLARRLAAQVGPDDMVARLGGEEFLLALTGTRPAAEGLCRTLVAAIAQSDWTPAGPVTISIGLAAAHCDEEVSNVLARADAALYRAKSGGRNRLAIDGDS